MQLRRLSIEITDRTSLDSDEPTALSLTEALRVWVIKSQSSRSAVSELLKTLKPFHPELPTDYRTLMRTPRTSVLKRVGSGKYIHIGLRKTISSLISDSQATPRCLSLQLHIDGLTLWNSSQYQLWPILARTVAPFRTTPFIIGVYGGMDKPADITEYLSDVIVELKDMLLNGIDSSNGI